MTTKAKETAKPAAKVTVTRSPRQKSNPQPVPAVLNDLRGLLLGVKDCITHAEKSLAANQPKHAMDVLARTRTAIIAAEARIGPCL